MKQQINFYSFLPKPSPYHISDRLIFRALTGLIAFLLLITVIQAIKLSGEKNALVKLQKEFSLAQKDISATNRMFEANSAEALEKELREKQKLLETLQARKVTSGRCALLSNYFTALAEGPVPGLWLTGISVNLNTDRIVLTGNAYAPGLLIELVKTLNNTACFSERQFGPVEMSKQAPGTLENPEKKEVLSFVVSSGDLPSTTLTAQSRISP